MSKKKRAEKASDPHEELRGRFMAAVSIYREREKTLVALARITSAINLLKGATIIDVFGDGKQKSGAQVYQHPGGCLLAEAQRLRSVLDATNSQLANLNVGEFFSIEDPELNLAK